MLTAIFDDDVDDLFLPRQKQVINIKTLIGHYFVTRVAFIHQV